MSVSSTPDSDLADSVILDGGPLDGREHPATTDTERLCVIMTDGQQHQYIRTGRTQELPGGRSALVFEYGDRHFGPK